MSELQLELATVIDHKPHHPIIIEQITTSESFCAAQGLRLAKMVTRYEDCPSSDAWRDMQKLARDMQK